MPCLAPARAWPVAALLCALACGGRSGDDQTEGLPCTPPPAVLGGSPDETLFGSLRALFTPQVHGDVTSAVQSLAQPAALGPERAALLMGQTRAPGGAGLACAKISVVGHPELGEVTSRADGRFELAVPGGLGLTLQLRAPSGQRVLRSALVAPRATQLLADVTLPERDDTARYDDLPIGRGQALWQLFPRQGDARGGHQGALHLPATLQRSADDGPAPPLRLSLTSYPTSGPAGHSGLPVELGAGLHHAFALTLRAAGESEDAAPQRTTRPMVYYVEDHHGLPVGARVPVFALDPQTQRFVAAPAGRVLRVLPRDAKGRPQVDCYGRGRPTSAAALAALGVDDDELRELAARYPAGQRLWRVPLESEGIFDLYWAYQKPEGAPTPPTADPILASDSQSGRCEDAQGKVLGSADLQRDGLRVECKRRRIHYDIPLSTTAGDPTLHYSNHLVQGYQAGSVVVVPLTGDSYERDKVRRVLVQAWQPGRPWPLVRVTSKELPEPPTNHSTTLRWDGLDAALRPVAADQVTVTLTYEYPATLQLEPADDQVAPLDPPELDPQAVYSESKTAPPLRLRSNPGSDGPLGGLELSNRYRYDSDFQTLRSGDGRDPAEAGPMLPYFSEPVAGTSPFAGPVPGRNVTIEGNGLSQPTAVAWVSDNGNGLKPGLYVAEEQGCSVRRVANPDLEPVVYIEMGGEVRCTRLGKSKEPLAAASLGHPTALVVDGGRALFIASRDDDQHGQVRVVDGVNVVPIAGSAEDPTPPQDFARDALQVPLRPITAMAIAPSLQDPTKRTLYLLEQDQSGAGTLRALTISGGQPYQARVAAGDGVLQHPQLRLSFPRGVAVAEEQEEGARVHTLFLSNSEKHTVLRVRVRWRNGQSVLGEPEIIAGRLGIPDNGVGDAKPLALDATLNLPMGLALRWSTTPAERYLFIAESGNRVVRRLHLESGRLEPVAGARNNIGAAAERCQRGLASTARFVDPMNLVLGGDSALHVVDRGQHNLCALRAGPLLQEGAVLVPLARDSADQVTYLAFERDPQSGAAGQHRLTLRAPSTDGLAGCTLSGSGCPRVLARFEYRGGELTRLALPAGRELLVGALDQSGVRGLAFNDGTALSLHYLTSDNQARVDLVQRGNLRYQLLRSVANQGLINELRAPSGAVLRFGYEDSTATTGGASKTSGVAKLVQRGSFSKENFFDLAEELHLREGPAPR